MSAPDVDLRKIMRAIRVAAISSRNGSRQVRAMAEQDKGGGLPKEVRVRYCACRARARLAALLAFLPVNLSDKDLLAAWNAAREASYAMAGRVAEDLNARAFCGGGPPGSGARGVSLHAYNHLGDVLAGEWARRNPSPVIESSDNGTPF